VCDRALGDIKAMRLPWFAAMLLVCLVQGPASFANTSEETETADVTETPTPTPARKSNSRKGDPQIEVGAAQSTSPRPNSAAIAQPPSHLTSSEKPSASSAASDPFIVAIDVGHSKVRFGAISARGVPEYEFNRRLAGELYGELRADGFPHTLLINPDGGEIGLVKRAQVANEHHAAVFLALHHDSVKDSFLKSWDVKGKPQKYCDDFHGFSVFFSHKNVAAARSLAFAVALGEEMVKAGFTPTLHHIAQEHRPIVDPDHGVYAFDDLLVLKNAKMPAALLECGVIVNRKEEEDLNNAKYRARITAAIKAALTRFAAEDSPSVKTN
jgi:N-acetylmuramoyl-L-alanine amidase